MSSGALVFWIFGAFVVWGLIFAEPAPGAPLPAIAAGWVLALLMTIGGAWIVLKYLSERGGKRRILALWTERSPAGRRRRCW